MSNVIVAIICNVVAGLILVSGIINSIKCGWKVALTKLILSCGNVVGTYFLTPFVSNKLLGIEREGITLLQVVSPFGITQPMVNACLFTIIFIMFYLFTLIVCSIVRHCLVKSMKKEATINKAKIKRAKSINPKAERVARKTAWKEMVNAYKSKNNFGTRLLSFLMNLIVSVALGIVVLMPFGYISKAFVESKPYLHDGYSQYTLNGIIGENFFDWAIHAEESTTNEEEEVEEVTPCEHSYVEGVCEHCGEEEVVVEE